MAKSVLRRRQFAVRVPPATLRLAAVGGAAPAVSLQLVMECYPINVKNFGRPALVSAAFVENLQNMHAFNLIQALAHAVWNIAGASHFRDRFAQADNFLLRTAVR